MNLWIDYNLPDYGHSLGRNITDVSSSCIVQVNVSGYNMSLFISFNPSMASKHSNVSLSNVNGSDPIFIFARSGPGLAAGLGVAQLDHESSFYVEFGMSWSTSWLGIFTHPGNKEVYSDNADTKDGTYLPFLAAGGNGMSISPAEFPHIEPGNTFEEPPW
ncbi:hypothetical protein Thermo_00854 [Thermoplasmatales archaeon]|nr:hypothetical protein Thermo_00854 [Thermoplasmatales archaeon]